MAVRKQQVQDKRIDDLKDYIKDRFDQQAAGQKKIFELYEAHVEEDKKNFKEISDNFTDLKTRAAEAHGEAKQKAATTGFYSGGVMSVISGLGVWLVEHFSKH